MSAPEPHAEVARPLAGRALALARLAWLITAALVVLLHLSSAPLAYSLYQSPDLVDPAELQLRGITPGAYASWYVALDMAFGWVSLLVAAVIFRYRSADRMALFVSFTMLLFGGVFFVSFSNPAVVALQPPLWRAVVIALSVSGLACFIVFLGLFPNGKFVPRILAPAVFAYVVFRVVATLADYAGVTLPAIELPVTAAFLLSIVAAQIYRYRRVSTPLERQQTKWVVYGLTIGLGGYLLTKQLYDLIWPTLGNESPLVMLLDLVIYVCMLLVPLSIAVAILRSRLYDIDLLIRRTLIYGVLTVVLAGAYVVSLFILQDVLLRGRGQTGAALIAISSLSALAIAALSRPLRDRIRNWIDRRFYRQRYDAIQVIAGFGASVREEIDVRQVATRLLETARQTMQPEHASLALAAADGSAPAPEALAPTPLASIARNEPLAVFFRGKPASVPVEQLRINSKAVGALRTAGAEVAVPLVSQRELVGVLALGPRRSHQGYSRDDLDLLNALAAEAAPAMRVAQLLDEQHARERRRARIEEEMQVARHLQFALLPEDVLAPAGWALDALYQPAREVGGDFYDLIPLPDGRLGIAIGDVTDKGMPAALVMAAARTMLRAVTQVTTAPGAVLAQVNELLCPKMPERMFVTCLFAVLDPATGEMHYANAGHDAPYLWRAAHAEELYARGMPLGLLPGSCYDESSCVIAPGEGVLFYTDGLIEAHDARRQMFGLRQLHALLAELPPDARVTEHLQRQLALFTGPGWEQEDDLTLLTLRRLV